MLVLTDQVVHNFKQVFEVQATRVLLALAKLEFDVG